MLYPVTFFNHAFYEIRWKNIVEPGRPDMTIRRMRISCWLPKATNTHSQYIILIAFPPQQLLHEPTSTYVLQKLPVLFRMVPRDFHRFLLLKNNCFANE